ncbi:MAG TPA: HD domain-containing phosphohydrolase [Spirochaetia bacterium]|nr:HD domain-containing phosphohydrolase [Spirochaetia bacterium]
MAQKVLIIDDDPAIRKVMSLRLVQEGYIVRAAESREEALQIIDREELDPDCIFLDIRMPGVTGIELLPELKERLPATPVVMLTAVSDLQTGMEAMRKGAYDYLVKPLDKNELLKALSRILGHRALILENARLAEENLRYQRSLEHQVAERTEELSQAYQTLQGANLDTVQMLAETIEAKDPYTRGHCHRVRVLSTALARTCGLSEQEIDIIEYSALLHDVGKIGIPEALLHKTGPLTAQELEVFHQHPVIGERILSRVSFFDPCIPIIRNHHERWDGLGYPDGLSGTDIPYAVRIVTVADSYDAMTSSRPYRKALPLQDALREMSHGAGTQFEPELVDAFISERVYEYTRMGEESIRTHAHPASSIIEN